MHILVADDHVFVREALESLLRRNIEGLETTAVGDFSEAIEAVATKRFDLLVLDYHMPGEIPFDGFQRIREQAPALPIVVVSGVADSADVIRLIQAGARGFIPKTQTGDVLISAVNVILAGGTYLPAEFIGATTSPPAEIRAAPPPTGKPCDFDLTPRETEILGHIAAGLSNKEIARKIGVQEVTIKFHSRQIFRKLGARNRTHATMLALESGLVGKAQP